VSRQALILEIIQSRGLMSVRDLAHEIQVDGSTVRRHLMKLESLGLISRAHGGVGPVEPVETPARIKQSMHAREKKAIGKAMAEQISDGQVILLDSGTTTLEVAKSLRNSALTVVTNDLQIAMELAKKPRINLVVIGGQVLQDLHTTWGPTAVSQIGQLKVELAIFGADAINSNGVFNNTSFEIESKKAMMAISSQAVFVADSSKFRRKALFKVFDLEDFATGITDESLSPDAANQFPLPIIRVVP
jgi:DeoR/GlpR family transcriptional regulator of sugar metabolism